MIAAYGLGICDGAVIVFRQLSFAPKINRITEVEHLTSSRTIANTLLATGFLFFKQFKILRILFCHNNQNIE